LHGCISLGLLGVPNEPEATTAPSVAILDDDSFLDLAILLELGAQGLVVGVPSKASNEELRHGEAGNLFDLFWLEPVDE